MKNLQEGIQVQAGLFMEGVRVLVEQAVMEAFANSVSPPETRGNGGQRKKRQGKSGSRSRRTPKTRARNRDRAEVAEVTERLYETIDSQPGQTMGVLARAMECEPNDLRVSMRKLLSEKRVKKAGERMHTAYFPMGNDQAVSHDIAEH